MKFILPVFFVFITFSGLAQDTTSIVVHKDPRLDMLVKKQAEINEVTARENRRTGKGYRLMVINTNNRDEAISAKTTVYQYFPELKPYLLYQSPYFKLKVGNFQTRDEAVDYQKKLNMFFPKGVFIIPDIIEIKPKKDDELSKM